MPVQIKRRNPYSSRAIQFEWNKLHEMVDFVTDYDAHNIEVFASEYSISFDYEVEGDVHSIDIRDGSWLVREADTFCAFTSDQFSREFIVMENTDESG